LEYKILDTQAALIGLDEIVEFIHKDNAAAAERFGHALLNHVDLLAAFPRIDEDKKIVHVIRFWHGSRKPPKMP
jgi:hypothetical protein